MRLPLTYLLVSICIFSSAFIPGCLSAITPLSQTPSSSPAFNLPIDPGFSSVKGLHFQVLGSDRPTLESLLTQAEQFYERLMQDTGLYSFRPREHYRIILYDTKERYQEATKQPDWSGGAAIGNTICLYSHPQWNRILAHEMTHVIFFEFLGPEAFRWRWVNEGLAMMQEKKSLPSLDQETLDHHWRRLLAEQAMPLAQITSFAPFSENERDVNLWYHQAESLIRFLIDRGGRLNFAEFLEQLKTTRDLERSLAQAFPGKFPTVDALEKTWKAELR